MILNTGHQASLISAALSMEARSRGLYPWAHLGNRRVVLLAVSQPQSLRRGPWPSPGQAGPTLGKKYLPQVLRQIFASIIMAVCGGDLWLPLGVYNPFEDKSVILVFLI